MKLQSIVIGSLVLAAAAFAVPAQTASGQSCSNCAMAMQTKETTETKPVHARLFRGVQRATITIDGGKYSPAAISVVTGKLVALTFKAGKDMGCGSTVVFPSLKITKEVPAGKSVTVLFTPDKEGTIDFKCGMGMYQGRVVVSEPEA